MFPAVPQMRDVYELYVAEQMCIRGHYKVLTSSSALLCALPGPQALCTGHGRPSSPSSVPIVSLARHWAPLPPSYGSQQ